MEARTPVAPELAKEAGRLVIHVVALLVGFIMMLVGVAMGVTMVMLPIGIPLGLAGLFVFLWGLFGRTEGI